jgi:CBS domain-containing protein
MATTGTDRANLLRGVPSAVGGIMKSPVVTVDCESTVREVAKVMARNHVGGLVVTVEGKPVAMVTERDILEGIVAAGADASRISVKRIMSKPLITVGRNLSIIEAIMLMRRKKIRRLPVLEKGRLIGIVTERDLLKAIALHVFLSFRPLM